MASTAIGFGIALLFLGVYSYFATGMESPTALIPAIFGLALLALGSMARMAKYRKMAMHIAVLVGLLGFLGSARGLASLANMLGGGTVARPNAVVAQSVMAVLCLLFVILCVRSFVNARRNPGSEMS